MVSSKKSPAHYKTLALVLLLLAWPTGHYAHAQAQPAIQINAPQSNLKQEYRDELDKWMLRAYEGDRDAQFKVGVLFTNDQFGPPDFEQAVYWYKQAARQGHVLAQYNLGHQYLTGLGVHQSKPDAMKWWLEAAKQDHALAQFNIGRAYYLGIGLQEDHGESKYWFERAASKLEPKSIDILKQLGWWDGPLAPGESSTVANNQDNNVAAPIKDQEFNDDREISIHPIDNTGVSNPTKTSDLTSKITPIASSTPGGQASTVESSLRPEAMKEVTKTETPTIAVTPQEKPTPATVATVAKPSENSIALYTNPAIRSVLIAILDDRESLQEIDRGEKWVTVQNSEGFPVWVHGDFLEVNDDIGVVSGQSVNARSVPIITNGTVVGKLKQDEILTVLDQRKGWYRVTAPERFKAWVKVADMNSVQIGADSGKGNEKEPATSEAVPATEILPVEPLATSPARPIRSNTLNSRPINDNQWMFTQPSNHFTLQLASFDDLAKVEQFEARAKFKNNPDLHRFTATGKNMEWTYFLYGSYSSRDAAEAAKVDISQKLAWVRSFGRLQQNRCVAWKTQLPTPEELNRYCTR